MNTLEEILKCRLYPYSLGYAGENYMIFGFQLHEAVGYNVSSISGLFIYLYKKINLENFHSR